MNEIDIKTILELIVTCLVIMIEEKESLSEKEALTSLYSSELYNQLEKEKNKTLTSERPYFIWII